MGMAKCLQLASEVLNTELSSHIWSLEKEPLRILGVGLGSRAPLSVFVYNHSGRHPALVTSPFAMTKYLRKTT